MFVCEIVVVVVIVRQYDEKLLHSVEMTILYLTFTSVGNYVTLSYFAPMTSLHNSISASVLCNWL